jgi:hypothetical protein
MKKKIKKISCRKNTIRDVLRVRRTRGQNRAQINDVRRNTILTHYFLLCERDPHLTKVEDKRKYGALDLELHVYMYHTH